MKNNISSKDAKATKKRTSPENKDNLDSRKNEEQEFKGGDVTHNEKAEKNKRSKKEN